MSQTAIAYQDETISHLCYRIYGNSQGMVEKVLAANPRLCELPPNMPAGTVIVLPQTMVQAAKQTQAIIPTINLWD